jgi:hypothetical protein
MLLLCVVVRRGSYGSQDLTRKRGSGEGEKKPKKELVGGQLDGAGLYFFLAMTHPYLGVCLLLGVQLRPSPLRSRDMSGDVCAIFLWGMPIAYGR